ncbi:MAG: amidohydrolase [Actinomycetia bacterium]|nr:amidohydrolase [Actinomycetes bacterium]MCP4962349.1 amidohydrolase [Actinomycetes bacterium]
MTELFDAASGVNDHVIELRRAIHREPEIGLDLPRTQAKVLDALSGLGLDISVGTSTTSIVADLDCGDGPTILLRADMDALPLTEESGEPFASSIEGVMHACAHDGHVAMLLGAARVLSERRSELSGRVRFMFQPGEEGYHGAEHMIEEGVLEGVDRCFALHCTTDLPVGMVACRVGPMLASADEFHITLTGKGGHGSAPHATVDPIPAACAIVPAISTMIARDINTFSPAVVSVTHINSGTTTNIIPETAFLEGTIRTFDEDTRALVHRRLEQIATSTAQSHQCTCDIDLVRGYGPTINDATAVADMEAATRMALGPDRYVDLPTPAMAAEDFSYLLAQRPGAMAMIGICPADLDDPSMAQPLHSNRMRMNEDGLTAGVAVNVGVVMRNLGNH